MTSFSDEMISTILNEYGIQADQCQVETLASGLINRTWKVTCGNRSFILQRINDNVFKRPTEIAENIHLLDVYLKEHSPDYLFVSPVRSVQQKEIVHDAVNGYFRMFPFIQGSHTINVVSTPEQAYEAALQFGKFNRLLAGFDASKLYTTIPNFHNLSLRYSQFEDALKYGDVSRIRSEHLGRRLHPDPYPLNKRQRNALDSIVGAQIE